MTTPVRLLRSMGWSYRGKAGDLSVLYHLHKGWQDLPSPLHIRRRGFDIAEYLLSHSRDAAVPLTFSRLCKRTFVEPRTLWAVNPMIFLSSPRHVGDRSGTNRSVLLYQRDFGCQIRFTQSGLRAIHPFRSLEYAFSSPHFTAPSPSDSSTMVNTPFPVNLPHLE